MFEATDVNLFELPFVYLCDRNKLPAAAGIYFVITATNEIIYIGRSDNIKSRWVTHHKFEEVSETGGCRIAYLVITYFPILGVIEKGFIEHYLPLLNCCKPGDRKRHEYSPVVNPDNCDPHYRFNGRQLSTLWGVDTRTIFTWKKVAKQHCKSFDAHDTYNRLTVKQVKTLKAVGALISEHGVTKTGFIISTSTDPAHIALRELL